MGRKKMGKSLSGYWLYVHHLFEIRQLNIMRDAQSEADILWVNDRAFHMPIIPLTLFSASTRNQ
jgi:hypothetical protein